ncbi:MAG: SRPBCC family protein, partial [Pseudomonadota bacterium]|nr:SRPBCC family protein [Pseudomonadota bacterium]
MLIRKSVAEVFEAFVDPAVTTKFWFTKSSGRLDTGERVTWEWEMYGVSTPVDVKAIETNKRILVEWSGANGPTSVEWVFKPLEDGTTFVSITNAGFGGNGDDAVNEAIDSAGGFALVLAGLKALLEHGIHLNLVLDRFPESCR